MRTSNPILKEKVFTQTLHGVETMTLQGAVNKTVALLALVVIASLNLVLDFDFIERGDGRAPKFMEWYAAFGLIVTLVWLYLEILRLLAKLRSR